MPVNAATFFEHLEPFIDYRQVILEASAETLKTNRIDLKLFQRFVKERQVEFITGPTIVAFQYHLKKDRGNSGPAINRKIFTLKSYAKFLQLEEVQHADSLPFKEVLKIRGGYRNRPNALTTEEVKTIFNVLDRSTVLGIRDYAAYALMYLLGLRIGEVHRLNLEDLNLAEHKLAVTGKGRKKRTLYLNAELLQILSMYLAVRNNLRNSDKLNALFISKKGRRLAIRTLEENFQKLVKTLTLPLRFKITCHTLRHTFASHLNDAGEDVLVIQSLLGHETPRSSQIYIHPSEIRVRQALEDLPGVKLINQLIAQNRIQFNFQKPHKQKKE